MRYFRYILDPGLILVIILMLFSCEDKMEFICGYNGDTIQVIRNKKAMVRDLGDQFYLYFGEGIKINPKQLNLRDTIFLLLPCNLPKAFNTDSLRIKVSGEIKENPGYSSHNNYTDFYVNRILKY